MQQIMPRDSTRNQTLKAIKPQPRIYETWYLCEPYVQRRKAFILFVVIDWQLWLAQNMNALVFPTLAQRNI